MYLSEGVFKGATRCRAEDAASVKLMTHNRLSMLQSPVDGTFFAGRQMSVITGKYR